MRAKATGAPPLPPAPKKNLQSRSQRAQRAPGCTTLLGRATSIIQDVKPATDDCLDVSFNTAPVSNVTCDAVFSGAVCLSLLETDFSIRTGSLGKFFVPSHERRVRESLKRHRHFHLHQDQPERASPDNDNKEDEKPSIISSHVLNEKHADDLAKRALRRDDIHGAIAIYEQLLSQGSNEVVAQLSLLHLGCGNQKQAMNYAQKALALNRDRQRPLQAAQAGLLLGMVNYSAGQVTQTLKNWREATQLACLAVGYDHIITAVLLCNIGVLHAETNQHAASIRAIEESLEVQRGLMRHSDLSNLEGALFQLATTMGNLGVVLSKHGQVARSIAVFDECKTVFGSMGCASTEESLVASYLRRLNIEQDRLNSNVAPANVSMDAESIMSETSSAGNSVRSAILFGNSDGIPDKQISSQIASVESYDHDILLLGPLKEEWSAEQQVKKTSRLWLGTQNDTKAATFISFDDSDQTKANKQSIPIDLDAEFVPNAELRLQQIHVQAMRHLDSDEMEDALDLFQSALRSHRAKYGNFHHLVASALHNIGMIHLLASQYVQAYGSFAEAVQVRTKALGGNHPDVQRSKMKMAFIRLGCGDVSSAENLLLAVRDKFQMTLPYGHPQMAKAVNNLAIVAYHNADLSTSYGLLKQSRKLLEHWITSDKEACGASVTLSLVINNMAYVRFKQSLGIQSLHLLKEALQIQTRCLPEASPHTSVSKENISFLVGDSDARNGSISCFGVDTGCGALNPLWLTDS